MSQTCGTSSRRSKTSTEQSSKPKDARELAAQISAVATMVLNNEIDIDAARTYSALTRNVAQLLSAEVQRARFLKCEPDLRLD